MNLSSPNASSESSLLFSRFQNLTDKLNSAKEADGDSGESPFAKVAQEFEAVFMSMMLKEMRNTLDKESGGLFGSEGSDTYGGMFDMMMGQTLAQGRHLGIADTVENSMAKYLALQDETESATTTTSKIDFDT